MFTNLKEMASRRELIVMLVMRNLKIRYKGSVLGFLWSLLLPVLMILLYGFFAHLLRFAQSQPNYLPFLMVGIIVWQFLTMCLNDALSSVVGNATLVKKAAFPRMILPVAMVTANLVNFLLTLAILAAFLFFTGATAGARPETLIPAILTQTAMCLGLSCLVGAANVFFRDAAHLLSVFLLAWFFVSPVFYPLGMQLGMLPDTLDWLPYLNPMTGLLAAYRHALMGEPVILSRILISCGVAWALLPAGVAVFRAGEHRFAEVL